MACSALHLLVAKEYCKKHNIVDDSIYLAGAIYPDIQEDKVASHFGVKIKPKSIRDALDSKIDIKAVLENLDLNDEFHRAIFLHLLTDYIYYNYLYNEELEKVSIMQVLADINNDSGVMTAEILKEHNVEVPYEYSYLLEEKENSGEYKLFNGDRLGVFVDLISSSDLGSIKKELLQDNQKFIKKYIQIIEGQGKKILDE